jgi:5-(carboxyamino)imidazole ribonucleotide mutase
MNPAPLVAIIMGSKSDWDTLRPAAEMLEALGVSHEARVVSAHRTPDLMAQFAKDAAARGIQVIIAGAGGAAHLPGMVAAHTRLPVLGVPVESKVLRGVDSLLSIVQMPAGVPVGTLAIGSAGARMPRSSLHRSSRCTIKRSAPRWRLFVRTRPLRSLPQSSMREADGFRSGALFAITGRI